MNEGYREIGIQDSPFMNGVMITPGGNGKDPDKD